MFSCNLTTADARLWSVTINGSARALKTDLILLRFCLERLILFCSCPFLSTHPMGIVAIFYIIYVAEIVTRRSSSTIKNDLSTTLPFFLANPVRPWSSATLALLCLKQQRCKCRARTLEGDIVRPTQRCRLSNQPCSKHYTSGSAGSSCVRMLIRLKSHVKAVLY